MAMVILSFMLGMYKNTKANIAIYVTSAIVFAVSVLGPQSSHRS